LTLDTDFIGRGSINARKSPVLWSPLALRAPDQVLRFVENGKPFGIADDPSGVKALRLHHHEPGRCFVTHREELSLVTPAIHSRHERYRKTALGFSRGDAPRPAARASPFVKEDLRVVPPPSCAALPIFPDQYAKPHAGAAAAVFTACA
jgi:hypothetical protein